MVKKKMQAMKVEKDNLCDRCDVVEQQMKDAFIRKEKAEEEYTELTLKARTLEIDLDKYGEKLTNQVMAQEAKEAQVLAAEAEFNRLNRRVQELEEDLKKAQNRAEEADRKYDEAQKAMGEEEAKLEIDGERADVSEYKIIELEEELKVVANNLKSLEVSEDKANKREDFYKVEIKRLTAKLKQ